MRAAEGWFESFAGCEECGSLGDRGYACIPLGEGEMREELAVKWQHGMPYVDERVEPAETRETYRAHISGKGGKG